VSLAWSPVICKCHVGYSVYVVFCCHHNSAVCDQCIYTYIYIMTRWYHSLWLKRLETVRCLSNDVNYRCLIQLTSSRGCPQQVVHVVLVDFEERHDKRTNGQHYTAADRRPTSQVSTWQAGQGSRRHARVVTDILVRMLTVMWNLSYSDWWSLINR